jgi:hypothetical protein
VTWEPWRVHRFGKFRRSIEKRRVPQVRFRNLGLGFCDAFWARRGCDAARVAHLSRGTDFGWPILCAFGKGWGRCLP